MPDATPSILVVDDEDAIRTSFSLVFEEVGYAVRTAENGFAAMLEIGKLIPDILLSDLNMPGMSGFELLPVVRRRFPAIRVIAMSGAFSGSEVPSGVAADAFYPKGNSIRSLLQIIGTLPQINLRPPPPPRIAAPLWIHWNGQNSSPEACATITCPECLTTFPHALDRSGGHRRETDCIHCGSSVQCEVVEPADRRSLQDFRRWGSDPSPAKAAPTFDS